MWTARAFNVSSIIQTDTPKLFNLAGQTKLRNIPTYTLNYVKNHWLKPKEKKTFFLVYNQQ